ncbi:hypothetical protein T440DRAFT_484466 [Plenodomus tracheiphilus IPT5]|uniref:Uncharacterized protein n=1 Tax=Plenodomus tracheiphilus IPT5 TaxID=1408161 RepID=A0A6A7APP9_9PLEO|nr:hypothetical protein T440DRAFT_484466 [Plenodomus tracheiphilus IPT5]
MGPTLRYDPFDFIDLYPYFSAPILTQMHEEPVLKRLVTDSVRRWVDPSVDEVRTVWMTCGRKAMPAISVRASEFLPQGSGLVSQIQYIMSPETQQRVAVKKQSPPLGMQWLTFEDEKRCDEYITRIVDHHLDAFGELCWEEEDNGGFPQKLLQLMANLSPRMNNKAKLLHEVLRLIVVTFIMSHTLTMVEEKKEKTLARMISYLPKSYEQDYTSPRLINRQLKFLFSRLQHSIQATVLQILEQVFKYPKDRDGLVAAFVAVLGMSMTQEDRQITIHSVTSTSSSAEGINEEIAQKEAVVACESIERVTHAVQDVFQSRYSQEFDLLRNADDSWIPETGFSNPSSIKFVREVLQLTKENLHFLQERQQVPLSHHNQTKYSTRLVARFLLLFMI